MSLQKKVRDSNVELLRIIAMIGIIMHHCVIHSNAVEMTTGINRWYALFIVLFGKIGVNIFVIISSWFLSDSKSTIRQIIRIWLQALFYYLFFLLVAILVGQPIPLKRIIAQFLPVVGHENWFVSCFLVFLTLVPVINILIKKCSSKVLLYLGILLLTIESIIPSLGIDTFYSDIVYFVTIYVITCYCRKCCDIYAFKKKWLIVLIMLSFLIVYSSEIITGTTTIISVRNYSFFLLIIGFVLFILFKTTNVSPNGIINAISRTTFGIFLFHTPNLLRHGFLWQRVFKCDLYFDSYIYIPWTILCTLILFILGFAFEYIRLMFERIFFNIQIIDKCITFIEMKFNSIFESE